MLEQQRHREVDVRLLGDHQKPDDGSIRCPAPKNAGWLEVEAVEHVADAVEHAPDAVADGTDALAESFADRTDAVADAVEATTEEQAHEHPVHRPKGTEVARGVRLVG